MCRSPDPPVRLSAPFLALPFQVRPPSHPLFNALGGLQMINSPNSTHRSLHSPVWPARDDERRRSPAARLSVILISSARRHFVGYQQCARLNGSGTPPLCCAASRLSPLSAHASDSPLFLEERMKKGQVTGSARGWERLEMCSCSLLSAPPAPLSLCLPLIVCSPPSRPRCFLSSVTSRSLTNTL